MELCNVVFPKSQWGWLVFLEVSGLRIKSILEQVSNAKGWVICIRIVWHNWKIEAIFSSSSAFLFLVNNCLSAESMDINRFITFCPWASVPGHYCCHGLSGRLHFFHFSLLTANCAPLGWKKETDLKTLDPFTWDTDWGHNKFNRMDLMSFFFFRVGLFVLQV